jgi:hypothetical protein
MTPDTKGNMPWTHAQSDLTCGSVADTPQRIADR